MTKRGVFAIILVLLSSIVYAQNSDFNNDNKVDFDDFFLFADQYGKNSDANNVKFDLDKNNKIDVEDFFIFADNFGKLIGDFDNNGCIDNKDFELANKELNEAYDVKGEEWDPAGSYPDDFGIRPRYDPQGRSSIPLYNTKIRPVVLKYDLNRDFYVFSSPPRGNNVTLAKKDLEIFNRNLGKCAEEQSLTGAAKSALALDCEKFEGKDKDYCMDLAANDINNLDASVCEDISDDGLKQLCKERSCIFSGTCPERNLKAYHVSAENLDYNSNHFEITSSSLNIKNPSLGALEFSSEEYNALQSMDDKAASGQYLLFIIQAPEGASLAKIDFRLEHPLQVNRSIGYLKVTGELEQATWENLFPNIFIRVDDKKYMRSDNYINFLPVVDGKVSFLMVPIKETDTSLRGAEFETGDTWVLNQLFTKVSYAENENLMSPGNYFAEMDSKGVLTLLRRRR